MSDALRKALAAEPAPPTKAPAPEAAGPQTPRAKVRAWLLDPKRATRSRAWLAQRKAHPGFWLNVALVILALYAFMHGGRVGIVTMLVVASLVLATGVWWRNRRRRRKYLAAKAEYVSEKEKDTKYAGDEPAEPDPVSYKLAKRPLKLVVVVLAVAGLWSWTIGPHIGAPAAPAVPKLTVQQQNQFCDGGNGQLNPQACANTELLGVGLASNMVSQVETLCSTTLPQIAQGEPLGTTIGTRSVNECENVLPQLQKDLRQSAQAACARYQAILGPSAVCPDAQLENPSN